MNYLGHLYFSKGNHALMLANLYGDFVKGKDYSYLPQIVQEGVTLHREIDDFIDHHPKVLTLKKRLYADLPKISSIAIDLYFDHLLAKNWKQFHKTQLKEYIDSFFLYALKSENQTFQQVNFHYPEKYISLLNIIYSERWIEQYQKISGLEMASSGLSRRINFENNLYEAPTVFINFEKDIEAVFQLFMADAKSEFF